MTEPIEHQRLVTRIILDDIGSDGFALAGSGAIREHGLTTRPTEDIDLFTADIGADLFDRAITAAVETLRTRGYAVTEARRAPRFARLEVQASDGYLLEVDFGVDWREHEPVRLEVGPVLALEDAIGNKVNALYSRAEVRDYLDVDAIRRSGTYTDAELLRIVAERDAGFDLAMFADQLRRVVQIDEWDVRQYGLDADDLHGIETRTVEWAESIHRDGLRAP